MQEKSDAELLREYARGSDAAFREIVTRHADLVYASALRQARSPELARDIAQTVFSDLVRKAPALAQSLPDTASLVGWLYRSTRFEAHTQMRDERRRQARERQAMQEFDPTPDTATAWERVGPVLDEAMADLADDDRDALLLRFFKNHDFRTIGAALGVSDDAAQKRVSRALDRLRAEFNRRGVTTSAVALTAALSANAVAVGPAGLAATLSTAALTSSTLAATATATATQATMNWFNLKSISAIIAAAIAAGTGTHLVQRHEANLLRNENQNLAAASLVLSQERDAALSAASQKNDKTEQSKKERSELLRLRGEVGLLRKQLQEFNGVNKGQSQTGQLVQGSSKQVRNTNGPGFTDRIRAVVTQDGVTVTNFAQRLVSEFIGTLLALDKQNQTVSIAAGSPERADRDKASEFLLTPDTKLFRGKVPATLDDGIIGQEVRYGLRLNRQDNRMELTVLRFLPSSEAQ